MGWCPLARITLALALLLTGAPHLHAQVDPAADWRTIRTEHFRVHFTAATEEQARRAAVTAERAWAALARELVPPRGTVELVIADDVDFSNGYATTFPTNRIVVYAHPPVDARSLRFYDDWNELVVTHELVHVFHLDRARGWWRAAQAVLGRNPLLFPAGYTPAWLIEGLAVYYESRLTGSGRLYGAEHRMLARAAAREGGVPRLDELSLATSRHPGGQSAYAYGSLLFEHLARTRGAERVPAFVERAAGNPVPYFSGLSARRAFGIGFARAWSEFRDSVVRAEGGVRGEAMPGWRDLTRAGRGAGWPRWRDSTQLVFGASTGRETPAAYASDLDGRVRRVGRRNGIAPNVPLAGGGLLWSQLEYTGAYRVRSDLWTSRGGGERRLTRDMRLAHPDARADGAIVAVQAVPAGTRLVRVTADGGAVRPLTAGSPDEQWAEPRWSPGGERIAAVRWRRGGVTDVVILDSAGVELRSLAGARAVNAAPAWTPDGRAIVFSSDRDGVPRLWIVAADEAGVAPRRLPGDAPGLFQPAPSPEGARLAAVRTGARGEYVGVAPLDTAAAVRDTVERAPPPAATPAARSDEPARGYAAAAQLLPRYWMPSVETGGNGGWLLGASTSGADVVGRHAWQASATWETPFGTPSIAASWRWAGLGQPVLELGAAQLWDWGAVLNASGGVVGHLGERTDRLSLAASLSRPRYRSSGSLAAGVEVERLSYRQRGVRLSDPFFDESYLRPAVFVSGGWSNAVRPALGISPEDGVALGVTARRARLSGGGLSGSLPASTTVVGTGRAYKSLDLPGFAHHVLALRLAGGWMERDRVTSPFSVGGISGTSLDVLPGVPLGESPRTFAVRGFAPSTLRASRAAAAGSLEYRAPLAAPSRGLGLVPLFLDRLSLAAFADAGAAWCHAGSRCSWRTDLPNAEGAMLLSAGGELVADFALQYDVPARARLGVGAPVRERDRAPGAASAYFTFGSSF